jgi:hypothetical protein
LTRLHSDIAYQSKRRTHAKARRRKEQGRKTNAFEQEETEGTEMIKTLFSLFPHVHILVFLFLPLRLRAFA